MNAATAKLDEQMETASAALARADYAHAEAAAAKALLAARRAGDFERMARITLPLQEARRQRRHDAADSGLRLILTQPPAGRQALLPGLYLVQPPLVGIDARRLRLAADAAGTAALFLCREPMTKAGLWPIVAVGGGTLTTTITLRTRIAPPPGVTPMESGMTRDRVEEPPPAEWFLAAHEALGDAAIAALRPGDPAAWRVDDLLEALDALPSHEKLLQALASACREAALSPAPERPRRRGRHDDPYSF
jgi:hypothetical protein